MELDSKSHGIYSPTTLHYKQLAGGKCHLSKECKKTKAFSALDLRVKL